jgi:hypothetical protein
MTTRTMTTVFLFYARGDDEPFVRRLHGDLTQAGFTVWFDRESLMSRGLTFHQEIKDAIRTEVNRVVYVGGRFRAFGTRRCGCGTWRAASARRCPRATPRSSTSLWPQTVVPSVAGTDTGEVP